VVLRRAHRRPPGASDITIHRSATKSGLIASPICPAWLASVFAFHTRNPICIARTCNWTLRAAKQVEATLLYPPAVGGPSLATSIFSTRVCLNNSCFARSACNGKTRALPLAMRMVGPRSAIWHALIRKNHAAHISIVGSRSRRSRQDSDGRPFYYGHMNAQESFKKHEAEYRVDHVPFTMMVLCLKMKIRFCGERRCQRETRFNNLAGHELRRRFKRRARRFLQGLHYPESVQELRRSFPPRHNKVSQSFTGLSGARKIDQLASVSGHKFLEWVAAR